MARSSLTLAALATAAVADLDVTATAEHSRSGRGDFDSALLDTRDGRRLIVRVPRSESAESEQSADLVALRALSTGIRSRLPFAVPDFAGQAPAGDTRAVVYDFLPGEPVELGDVTVESGLAASVGGAIAAIHALPTGFVGEAGLPHLTAAECHASTQSLIDQANGTRLLPLALHERWRAAADDVALWQFQPTVINGSLTADDILADDDRVTAVLGWEALRVGDPARDLHWLLGLSPDATHAALTAYSTQRQLSTDRQFTQRALLYAELEIARWLLHGRQVHSQEIVEDAVAMLDGLVDRVQTDASDSISDETGPIMAISDVEALLEQTPGDSGSDDYGHRGGMKPVAEDDRDDDREDERD